MKQLLLDTHYWLWFQMGNAREIGPEARDRLIEAQRQGLLMLSAVSVWEVARLVSDGHLELAGSVDAFVEEALQAGGLRLVPLSTRILIESTRLPGEMHRKPSDRLLVGTAREHGMTLVTRDKRLLAYGRQGYLQAVKV